MAQVEQVTGLEAVDMIMRLQDVEIDMLVIPTWMINHLHCDWNYQPADLRERISRLVETPEFQAARYPQYELEHEYYEYYREHSIEGHLSASGPYGYPNNPNVWVIGPLSKDQPLKIGDIREVPKTCHMADCELELIGSEPGQSFMFNANTTRLYEGSRIYWVDIQYINVNYEVSRRQSLIKRIGYDFPVEEAVLSGPSLQIARDLFAAIAA